MFCYEVSTVDNDPSLQVAYRYAAIYKVAFHKVVQIVPNIVEQVFDFVNFYLDYSMIN